MSSLGPLHNSGWYEDVSPHADAAWGHSIPGYSSFEIKLYINDSTSGGRNTVAVVDPTLLWGHISNYPAFRRGEPVNSGMAQSSALRPDAEVLMFAIPHRAEAALISLAALFLGVLMPTVMFQASNGKLVWANLPWSLIHGLGWHLASPILGWRSTIALIFAFPIWPLMVSIIIYVFWMKVREHGDAKMVAISLALLAVSAFICVPADMLMHGSLRRLPTFVAFMATFN